jgi:hypothetical protein
MKQMIFLIRMSLEISIENIGVLKDSIYLSTNGYSQRECVNGVYSVTDIWTEDLTGFIGEGS